MTKVTLEECIERCTKTSQVCEIAIQECVSRETDLHHVRVLQDCVDICQTAISFMVRNSERHAITCLACATVCEACAEECESSALPALQNCADACRASAESCEMMSHE